MMKKIKKYFAIILCLMLVFSTTSCAKSNQKGAIEEMFDGLSKISYSNDYKQLSATRKNSTQNWRHGMVSGNGMQGFVTSSAPYSDTFIFQNIHFIMPNENSRSCPVTSDELETVKQSIIEGKDITDNASYDDVYCYHPGGQLRLDSKISGIKDYVRYTDYETGIVGVHYSDKKGVWERKSFTSMADGAVITQIAKSSEGSKVNMTLSYDDISTLANYGDGNETDIKYKKLVSNSADSISFIAHYPEYENSELKDGGYSTFTYVITEGGSKEKGTLDRECSDKQYCGDSNPCIKITDANSVYLITVSDRTYNMGKINDFENQNTYSLTQELYNKAKAVASKYISDSSFDFDKALDNHLAIYQPQFNAVELSLGSSNESNETLLKSQRRSDKLQSELMQRAYYSGRYAYLCCSGYSTSRLYGMWTGEWNAGWGSKYTMDANVNLQTSSMNTSNISSTPVGYTYFILRQISDWQENAYATHGFTDALQAPVNTDGDCAVITETCYSYPFRYWNAGTSWMLEPLYETLECYGDIQIPLSEEFDLNSIKDILDIDDTKMNEIKSNGYMLLEEDILFPLLKKSANYWKQLLSAEYYTDKNGKIHYSKGKTSLAEGETYCIVPSYSPENNPKNYNSPSTANCAIDISACKSNMQMLINVAKDVAPDYNTAQWQEIENNLPAYLYDDTGALKEWATTSFEENNEHRHLSHLYCAWPLFETQNDSSLKSACEQAVANRESENEASHALVHRSLIASRLKDREALSDALTSLMSHKIHYNSLMTNHDYDRGSCYCTDFSIGYLGIVNESLVFSDTGKIEVLPCLPTSGFDKGEIKGIKARTRATIKSLKWEYKKNAQVTVESDVAQTLKISCPLSDDSYSYTFKKGESKTFTFKLN